MSSQPLIARAALAPSRIGVAEDLVGELDQLGLLDVALRSRRRSRSRPAPASPGEPPARDSNGIAVTDGHERRQRLRCGAIAAAASRPSRAAEHHQPPTLAKCASCRRASRGANRPLNWRPVCGSLNSSCHRRRRTSPPAHSTGRFSRRRTREQPRGAVRGKVQQHALVAEVAGARTRRSSTCRSGR